MLELIMKQMGVNPAQIKQQFDAFQQHHNSLVTAMQGTVHRVEALHNKIDRIEAMIAAMMPKQDGSSHDDMDPANFPDRETALVQGIPVSLATE